MRRPLLSALLGLAACAGADAAREREPSEPAPSPAPPAVGPAEDDRPPLPSAAFDFAECDGPYERARRCGTAKVPLDYAAPAGETIDLFVARFGSTSPDATQVYVLSGSPGESAVRALDYVAEIGRLGKTEVIVVEHRGTGRSTPLRCAVDDAAPAPAGGSDAVARAAACRAELAPRFGERLKHFTASNAARDLGVAITSLKRQQRAFVFGHAYGSYVAQRFLQLTPVRVDGVILDSAIDPARPELHLRHRNADPVLRRIARACSEDFGCSVHLGDDPLERMTSILATADSLPCAGALGMQRPDLGDLVATMMLDPFAADLVPSAIYRFERCDEGDREALARLTEQLAVEAVGRPPGPDELARALYRNVVASELWPAPPPSVASLVDVSRQMVVETTTAPRAGEDVEGWPRYERDRYWGKRPETDVPILTLQGDFDVTTAIEDARALENGLEGPNKYFLVLPYGTHGALRSFTVDNTSCGLELVRAFLAEPTVRPPVDCTARTFAYSPSSFSNVVVFYYGQPSAWANGPIEAAVAPGRGSIGSPPARGIGRVDVAGEER